MVPVLACAIAAQHRGVPADGARARRKLQVQRHGGVGTGKQHVFLRQPFQDGAFFHAQPHALRGRAALGLVPARGAWRGQQGVGAGLHGHIDLQLVAASHAAGRVQQHGMADAGAFGVQRFLHAQRAAVACVGKHAALAGAVPEAQLQHGLPARGGRGHGGDR